MSTTTTLRELTLADHTDRPSAAREAMYVILDAATGPRPAPIGIYQNGPGSDILVVRFAARDDLVPWLDYFGLRDAGSRIISGPWRGWHVQLDAHDNTEPDDTCDVPDANDLVAWAGRIMIELRTARTNTPHFRALAARELRLADGKRQPLSAYVRAVRCAVDHAHAIANQRDEALALGLETGYAVRSGGAR